MKEIGRGGGDRTHDPFVSWGTIAHTLPVPAPLSPHRNDWSAESRGSRVDRPYTACDLPAIYIHGRCRRCTEGFRGDLDSLPSAYESALQARCGLRDASLRFA